MFVYKQKSHLWSRKSTYIA